MLLLAGENPDGDYDPNSRATLDSCGQSQSLMSPQAEEAHKFSPSDRAQDMQDLSSTGLPVGGQYTVTAHSSPDMAHIPTPLVDNPHTTASIPAGCYITTSPTHLEPVPLEGDALDPALVGMGLASAKSPLAIYESYQGSGSMAWESPTRTKPEPYEKLVELGGLPLSSRPPSPR